MLSRSDVLRMFHDSGALLSGHFLLSSGLHSPSYLEKFLVLQHPQYVQPLCEEIASRFKDAVIDVVLGPTTGGVLLAYEVAKQLGTRGIFAERDKSGERVLRRGFAIQPHERVLVVDDILTTGGSLVETLKVVDAAGATLAGIAVLADRSSKSFSSPYSYEALLRLEVEQYQPETCPLCRDGVPLTKRGTTPTP